MMDPEIPITPTEALIQTIDLSVYGNEIDLLSTPIEALTRDQTIIAFGITKVFQDEVLSPRVGALKEVVAAFLQAEGKVEEKDKEKGHKTISLGSGPTVLRVQHERRKGKTVIDGDRLSALLSQKGLPSFTGVDTVLVPASHLRMMDASMDVLEKDLPTLTGSPAGVIVQKVLALWSLIQQSPVTISAKSVAALVKTKTITQEEADSVMAEGEPTWAVLLKEAPDELYELARRALHGASSEDPDPRGIEGA